MGLNARELADGEEIILSLRSHWKTVLPAMIVAVLLAAAVLVAWFFSRAQEYGTWVTLGAAVVAVLVGIAYVVLPFWRWMSTQFVVTNRRVSQRSGLLTRVGRDIPLHRVNDLAATRTPLDRMLGCGNLLISDATEKSGMEFVDVPDVEAVQVTIQNLLYRHDDGSDDGEWPPNEPRRPRGR